MHPRKIIIRSVLLVLLIIIIIGVWYAWRAFPIISGYGAKNLASAVYLQHRNPEDVIKEELGSFPLSLGSFTVNEEDSSVTGSVWGFAKRKAIYRERIGCTLINDLSEVEVRKQRFDLPALPQMNHDTVPWPYGDKIVDTLPGTINKPALEKAMSDVLHFSSNGKHAHTKAVLVLYDEKIVGEQYAPGFDKNSVLLGWSMSKSLTAALIGVLVKAGKLNVNAPAPVPEWQNTAKEKITLKHLLQQTTGLDFEEDYTAPSEATNMLFNQGDMAAFTSDLPVRHDPGTAFSYSSGNSNILGRIIRHTVGETEYPGFPFKSLFHKINMYSLVLEPDASGTYIASSYSYATARDFARFGLLYYNNGVWNGQQILPVHWVTESLLPAAANRRRNYGYQFWLNGSSKSDSTKRWYPDAPSDMFFADGYGGQNIFIIPSKKLIVVRLGLHGIDENHFLKEVIRSVGLK